jgi:hypothetical protein
MISEQINNQPFDQSSKIFIMLNLNFFNNNNCMMIINIFIIITILIIKNI